MDNWEEFVLIVEIDWWLHDCLLTHLLFAGLVERPNGQRKDTTRECNRLTEASSNLSQIEPDAQLFCLVVSHWLI